LKTKMKKGLLLTVGAVAIASFSGMSVYAVSTMRNWAGETTIERTKQFIDQATDKLIAQNNTIKGLEAANDKLEKELEDAVNNSKIDKVVDTKPESNLTGTTASDMKQLKEENDYLYKQLETANRQIANQSEELTAAYNKLKEAGINIQ